LFVMFKDSEEFSAHTLTAPLIIAVILKKFFNMIPLYLVGVKFSIQPPIDGHERNPQYLSQFCL
jgi:hypothetical protein